MLFFHILESLKSPSIKDVTWTILFATVCMILLKNFEIRTVLYENDLVAKGTCHSQSSQFLSAQDSVHSLITRLKKGIFNPTDFRNLNKSTRKT